MSNKILVTGSSGFIGRAIYEDLRAQGSTVKCLVRHRHQGMSDSIFWNPDREEIHLDELEGFDAVIHLAGRNITTGRWTQKVKDEIFLSRVRQTWLLSRAISRLKCPPKLFFCASAVGFYGDRGEELLTESSPRGAGFLAEVCDHWEGASRILEETATKVVRARFGVVLSSQGGLLAKLLPLYRWGLGGVLGNGEQWMSWIALEDVLRGLRFVLEHPQMEGVYNFTSPQPVKNQEFSAFLGKTPWRVPAWVLKAILGQKAQELLLASTKAVPTRLLEAGFQFKYHDLEAFFKHVS